MKINRKYYSVVFGFLVSIAMAFFMSLILTLTNIGFDPNFWNAWLLSFVLGFAASLPISLVIVPIIRKLVDKITTP